MDICITELLFNLYSSFLFSAVKNVTEIYIYIILNYPNLSKQ